MISTLILSVSIHKSYPQSRQTSIYFMNIYIYSESTHFLLNPISEGGGDSAPPNEISL